MADLSWRVSAEWLHRHPEVVEVPQWVIQVEAGDAVLCTGDRASPFLSSSGCRSGLMGRWGGGEGG